MSIFEEIKTDLHAIGYDFRVNDLVDMLEVKTAKKDWCQLDDFVEDIIKLDMREIGYGFKKSDKPGITPMLEGVSKLAHSQRYNPIKDYFNHLEKQYKPGDRGAYTIYNCANYFSNPDGCFGDWLFKWMVGAVAKVFTGARNPMLVLAGPQKIGKSRFAEWLCPRPDWFVRGKIDPDSKDHRLRQAMTLIWEADELGSTTRRSDADELKSFLTLSEIYERPPFGKHPIRKPAVVSFIGTANFDGSGLLNDPTGTSRFLACEISHINFGYSLLNVDDLWAEAAWFFKHVPYSWELTAEQEAAQARINADFEIISALSDTVESLFDILPGTAEFMTTQAIKNTIAAHYHIGNEQSFFNELSRVLTKMGMKKDRETNGGKRGWLGIRTKI
jgi:predicted P-loop ATPase